MKHASPDNNGGHFSRFEKRVNGHWRLCKLAHATIHHPVGRGVYYDTHELFNSRTEETIPCEQREWAEVDGGRLVWAEDGKLYAGHLSAKGLSEAKMVDDCNPMQFEKLEAPY